MKLFDVPGDEDWFMSPATKDVVYTIATFDLATGVDTRLEIYDSDGYTLLMVNDDFAGGLASKIIWRAPYSGTFFVRIVAEPSSVTG